MKIGLRKIFILLQPPDDALITDARYYIESSEKHLPENLSKICFGIGQRVRHAIMGEGTVIDLDMDKNAHIIKFDSMDTLRMISFRVKLEKLE